MKALAKLMLLLFCVLAEVASAATVVIDDPSGQWRSISGAPPTWVLPEPHTGGDAVGDFLLDKPIGQESSGYLTMGAPGGGISDYLIWNNSAPGGNGEITIYADPGTTPSLPNVIPLSLCTVDPVAGCISAFELGFTDNTVLELTWASAGDDPFDPFGAGFNTSAGIEFRNATLGTPEPSPGPMALLAFGGLLAVSRRRIAGNCAHGFIGRKR
jgi:MYXO-CTERM domain-containing protein